MIQFLTVKESARLTGKSPSSIRRVIYPIIQDENHPDRSHIEPTIDDVKALRTKGENFAWRIREELLRRKVPIAAETANTMERHASREATNANAELLAMLRRELDIKNHQITQHSELIAKQMELISGLGERLREGNILIGSLQQRLALPDAGSSLPLDAVAARRSKPTTKMAKRIVAMPSKKRTRFLSFLFR